jgi:hypothetical protein
VEEIGRYTESTRNRRSALRTSLVLISMCINIVSPRVIVKELRTNVYILVDLILVMEGLEKPSSTCEQDSMNWNTFNFFLGPEQIESATTEDGRRPYNVTTCGALECTLNIA